LTAHLGQGRGVQHAGHFVDRQQLAIAEHVAAIERHHVLGPYQRGFAVGKRNQVGGNAGIGGGGPGRRQLAGPQRSEH
jgi:hypothetical protein